MMYKVFFDSNQLWNKNGPLGDPFDNSIKELHEFLTTHGVLDRVKICLPEIVIKERIQTKMEEVSQNIQVVNDRLASLRTIGYETVPIEELESDIHKAHLEKRVANYLKEYSVTEVKNGSIDINNLIEKAITKIKPFNDKGVGLKDTLIFLSMIEDAKEILGDANYIFCSNNTKQFDSSVIEQFEKATGKKMFIVNNVEGIKEKLDELVPLELHLEERNNAIKELVMRKVGSVTKELNKSQFVVSSTPTYDNLYNQPFTVVNDYWDSPFTASGQNELESRVMGYDFNDITFYNIEERANNSFEVDAEVTTDIAYEDIETKSSSSRGEPLRATVDSLVIRSMGSGFSVYDGFQGSRKHKPTTRVFRVRLTCRLDDGTVGVLAAI